MLTEHEIWGGRGESAQQNNEYFSKFDPPIWSAVVTTDRKEGKKAFNILE